MKKKKQQIFILKYKCKINIISKYFMSLFSVHIEKQQKKNYKKYYWHGGKQGFWEKFIIIKGM